MVLGRIPNLAKVTDLQKLATSLRTEAQRKRGEMQSYQYEAAKLAEHAREQLTGKVLDKTVPPKTSDEADPNQTRGRNHRGSGCDHH